MNQTEFNKKEQEENILTVCKSRNLDYKFVISEYKRNRWNISLNKAEVICKELNCDYQTFLIFAINEGVLSVDNQTKKKILKNAKRANSTEYTNGE